MKKKSKKSAFHDHQFADQDVNRAELPARDRASFSSSTTRHLLMLLLPLPLLLQTAAQADRPSLSLRSTADVSPSCVRKRKRFVFHGVVTGRTQSRWSLPMTGAAHGLETRFQSTLPPTHSVPFPGKRLSSVVGSLSANTRSLACAFLMPMTGFSRTRTTDRFCLMHACLFPGKRLLQKPCE